MIVESLLENPENVKWWEPSGQVILIYMPLLGVVFAVFGLLTIILTFFSVDERFHKISLDTEMKKVSFKAVFRQMIIPARDKKFRRFLTVELFNGISAKIIGLIIIPFLTYVLHFVGNLYFIYIFVSITCKFGWFFVWKKILRKHALIKAYSICIAFSVIASLLELFFLIEQLSFEFKIALFIVTYGTILGSMYGFGLFSSPLASVLIDEAAMKVGSNDIDKSISKLSGAYFGLQSFMASIGPSIASIIVGFILIGPNEENPIIITICLASTGLFYLIALISLIQIKLHKDLSIS